MDKTDISRVENMKINLLDIEDNNIYLELKRQERETEIEWIGTEENYSLKMVTDKDMKEIKGIEKSENINGTNEEIRLKFFDILFEYKMKKFINNEDGFDDSEEEEEDANKIDPYDPKLIRVDTKTFAVFQVNQMIEDKEIDLSPDFQRGFVWNDITRKSRLIESILLRIPIPVFYLAQDYDGRFQVVDGVQRLTVINSFMKNEFKLKNLEYLTECNGRWYKKEGATQDNNLDGMYIRRIEQTQLSINVIDPQTPGKVKYDIFKRINTGGKALNNQEIRNCLANNRTRGFIRDLAASQSFLNATRRSVSPTRMADQELILRFIAFYLIDNRISTTTEYKGGMDVLLDETIEKLNDMKFDKMKKIRTDFLVSMKGAYYLFGNNAFRKSNYINKSLFLGVSRVLSKMSYESIEEKDQESISKKITESINKNIVFRNALSMATNDARNIKTVYDTIYKIIGE